MTIKQIKNRLLDLNFLRKIFGYKLLSSKFSHNIRFKILDKMPRARVLVLSPHPDDDIFGCGGTLKKFIDSGSKIRIIYLTNAFNKKRVKEARYATQILGINDVEFLPFNDGALDSSIKKIKLIREIIHDFKPEIIFVPYYLDSHNDHRACAKILGSVLKKYDFSGKIISYEVWTPLTPNRIIKIDEAINHKIEAMKAHKSQLQNRNYIAAMEGLNRYRANMFGAGKYAEAFFVCGEELYRKLSNG